MSAEVVVRSPNPEQKLAIEHSGGVLLSAGAGSGKTFVLVEHIIYLLKEFQREENLEDLVEVKIKKYLNSIVMMTFTKKAAGEMATRLYKRVQVEQSLDPEQKTFWETVSRSLSHLYVGTIHGFCYKLISANFFPELKSHFDIIDADSQKTKIEDLFEDWYSETRKVREEFLNQIILSHRKQVLNSVFEVFSNPDLRDFWSTSKIEDLSQIDMANTIEELLEDESWGRVTSGRFDLSPYEADSDKAWYKNILGFIDIIKSGSWDQPDFWQSLLDFFANVRWTKTSKKNQIFEVDEFIEDIKLFKEFVRADGPGLVAYLKNQDVFKSWVSDFHGLFKFIEERYEKLGGLTFSDLEYYVLKGLKGKPWAIKKIGEQYKYFIVDEFQDTSEVQFDILKNLVDQDFSKLFCVGDVKQAIYGFRGGELGVFRSCSKVIPKNLELSKNYRSKNKIIHLNNTLFDFLFQKGVNYSGVEKNPVEVQYQEYPGDEPESGRITKLKLDVSFEKKPTSRDMDMLEAGALYEEILNKSKEEGSIGILYKNLGASAHLIPKLVDSGLSFTAQVKIPLNEGPLWALFSSLLEAHLDKDIEEKLENVSFVIFGILKWLGCNAVEQEVREHVAEFFSNVGLLGFLASFEVMISNLGICDADFDKNFSKITHLNELAGEDPEKLFNLMYEFGPEKISVEFRYGDNPENIFLMTAHGSKGLEFDHVFLGGIHTNGRRTSDSPLLGKLPGSLKWKLDTEQKDYFKSPIYLLEERRLKKKDFAESKRLFYVACTRAQNSLSYVDLRNEEEGLMYSADSWINGFRLYQDEDNEEFSFRKNHITNLESEISFEGRDVADDVKAPLFHDDNLGILFKEGQQAPLGLLAEVSVTRLATLAQCPRKFYLSNVCKIDEEDLEVLGIDSDQRISDLKTYREEVDGVFPVPNTRERGIEIHEAISKAIYGNLVCPLNISGKDKKSVEYALDLLRAKNTYALLSEVPVKFSLFGQMISGTPDLVLIPEDKDQIPEIWDFKTGSQKENSELAYWFQLYCYAIQTCLEMGLSDDDKILVALVYVDQEKFVEKIFTKKEIESELFKEWKKLADFNQVNIDHCGSCSFGNLCQLNSSVVARP